EVKALPAAQRPELGEQVIDTRRWIAARLGAPGISSGEVLVRPEPLRDPQILSHREIGKDPGILRRVADAPLRAPVSRAPRQPLPAQPDRPAPHWQQP